MHCISSCLRFCLLMYINMHELCSCCLGFFSLWFHQCPLCWIMAQLQQGMVGSAASFLQKSTRKELNSCFLLSVPFLLWTYFERKEWLLPSIWKIIMCVLRRWYWAVDPWYNIPVVSHQGSSSRKIETFIKIYPDGVLLMSYRQLCVILNNLSKHLALCIEIINSKCGFPFPEAAFKCLSSSLL